MKKSKALYSLIGVFIGVGMILASSHSALASDYSFSYPVTPPTTVNSNPYTDYLLLGNSTSGFYAIFYNSTSKLDNGGGYSPVGTGAIVFGDFGGGQFLMNSWTSVSGGEDGTFININCSGSSSTIYVSCSTNSSNPHNFNASWIGVNSDIVASSRDIYMGSTLIFTATGNQPQITRFISVSPYQGSTTATTTNIGASVYANHNDFPNYGRVRAYFTQDGSFACQNSGAVYDAVVTCAPPYVPAQSFEIDFDAPVNQLISGNYSLSTSTTFFSGGKWTAEFDIQQVSAPWYYFGLFHTYNTIVATTTHFIVGYPSPIDVAIQGVQIASAALASTTAHGIGAILASTTASLTNACNPFASFNMGDCLTLIVWPGNQAISDDFTIIKQTPPWGYVFRFIDILNAPVSSTSLPMIDYTFATTSPMHVIGDIHFDPFGEIGASSELIGQMTSDRGDGATVWTILMPVVKIFVYLVLIFLIINDLTGIHSHNVKSDNKKE